MNTIVAIELIIRFDIGFFLTFCIGNIADKRYLLEDSNNIIQLLVELGYN
jgi:hypothetical protein